MEIAVVILNYNGQSYLEEFLPKVVEYSKGASIWVVDNCSTDNSVDFLKKNYPDLQVLINESNGGFAKGYNDGLKQIEADYYVLVNSDIEVTPNWLNPCMDLIKSDPSIAAVQPKILSHKSKTKFEHAGAAGGFLDKHYYPFCRGRIFERIEDDNHQYDDNMEVFWATGACLFIKSELYHQFEGFDEEFFAHMEEIDLCWRLKRHGYKIYYCGFSTVYHLGGGTLDYMSPRKTYLNFRNSLYMIAKNHEGILFPKLLKRLVIDGLGANMFLLKFQLRHFWAVFKAHMDFYAKWHTFKKKRRALQASSKEFNKKGLFKKNITFKKFLGGLKTFTELEEKDFH